MVKRIFDVSSSLTVLVLLSPLLFIVAIWVKLDSQGSIFFIQRRSGLGDKEFSMYKFRTMSVGTPEVATDKLTNSQEYITKVGYYLRKYSIDELPQLINILLGDMSVVGPRPALYNQYDLRDMRRTLQIDTVRPGLTGWAQVHGRDDISLDEKVCLDHYYVQHQNFWLDVKIIYCTIFSITQGTGVAGNSKNTP